MFLASTDTTEVLKDLVNNPSALEKMWNDFWPGAIKFIISVVIALIIWMIGRKLIRFVLKLIEKGFEKAGIDKGISKFLLSIVKFAAYVMLLLIVVGTVGIETSSVIGIISSVTLAIGLSFQGSLSNIAGGVLIIIFKPFTVGDYVVANGTEGTVDTIDLIYTKLITIDNKLVTVPNGTLANSVVVNVGKENTRRIDIPVSIAYSADIKKAKEVLNAIINENSYVIKNKSNMVVVTELAESSVNLEMRVWVQTADYWNAKFALLELIKSGLDENGVEIPFNQLDVHIK